MQHLSTTTTQKFLRFTRRGALLLVLLALLRPLGASAQAVVSTLVGGGANGTTRGSTNGTGTAALFDVPFGVAVDGAGNVYVADNSNNKIRKVSPAGVVTTLAGGGTDGITAGSTNGTGTAALFSSPAGVAVDGGGNVYVADAFNYKIRKVSPAGVVTTLAGGGTDGITFGSTDGTGTAALFGAPYGVAVDGAGNVYVADAGSNKIRKVSPAGVVTTLAGGGANGITAGSTNGTGTAALFYGPFGVAVDGAGNVYVADTFNNKIRQVSPAGVVTTLAGGGTDGITLGSTDGTGTAALFIYPFGVAVDGAGNVYVADAFNYKIRKVRGTALATARPAAPEVALYPSPARGSFTVQLPAGLAPGPAELLNSLGQVVRRPAGAAPRFTVETAGLAPGIYTLRLALGAAGTVARRVVVE